MLNSMSDDVTTALTLKGTGRVCKENHPYKKVKKTSSTINVHGRKFLVKHFFPAILTPKVWKNLSPKRKDMEKIVIIKSKWDL